MTKMTSPARKHPVSEEKKGAQRARKRQARSARAHAGAKGRGLITAKTPQVVVTVGQSQTVQLVASVSRALDAARSFQEVTRIRGEAEGIRAYAKALNDWTLETDAVEIRVRATRRLGQMIVKQKQTEGLSKGNAGLGRPKKGAVRKTAPIPSLKSQGINDHLRKQAWTLARPSDELFEQVVTQWRKRAEASSQPLMRDLMSSLRKAAKGEQTDWVGHSELDFSRSGERIDRVRQENALAPDRLKLDQTTTSIIDIVAAAVGKLKKLASRIDQPGVTREFQAVVDRMAERVTELVEYYRTLAKSLEEMDRAVERRATWRHSDIQPDPPEDGPPEPEPPEEDEPPRPKDGDAPDIPF